MIFAAPLANEFHRAPARVILMSRVIWPALATLVPAGVTAAVSWTQSHSRDRRRTELTDRICVLAKSILELPDIAMPNPALAVTPKAALVAELESAVRELSHLQEGWSRRFAGATSLGSRLRAIFLLYKPKGAAAYALHAVFYLYSICMVALFITMLGMLAEANSASEFTSNLVGVIVVFMALGIPPLVLRYFASRIHHRQCLEAEISARTAVVTV
jgi:hypothetical protein